MSKHQCKNKFISNQEEDPDSLIMISPAENTTKHVINPELPLTRIYIKDDTSCLQSSYLEILVSMNFQPTSLKELSQIIDKEKNNMRIVLAFPKQILKGMNAFSRLQEIQHLICYGKTTQIVEFKRNFSKNIVYIQQEQQLQNYLDDLEDGQKKGSFKRLFNFVPLNSCVRLSNNLIRGIYAMLRQPINKNQINQLVGSLNEVFQKMLQIKDFEKERNRWKQFLQSLLDQKIKYKDAINALFQIFVCDSQESFQQCNCYASLKGQSKYAGQDEILFNPLAYFKVLQNMQVIQISNIKETSTEKRKYLKALVQSQKLEESKIISQKSAISGLYEMRDFLQYWMKYEQLVQKKMESSNHKTPNQVAKLQKQLVFAQLQEANYYELNQNYQKSTEINQAAIEYLKTINLEKDLLQGIALTNLGSICHRKGDYINSQIYLKQSLELFKQDFVQTSYYQKSFNNLLVTWKLIGKNQMFQYQQLYRLKKNKKLDLGYAIMLNNIAMYYQSCGKFSEVEPLYQEALEITSSLHGELTVQYAQILANFGKFCHIKQKKQKAPSILKKALQILKLLKATGNQIYIRTLMDMSEIFASQSMYQKAKGYFLRAQRFAAIFFGRRSIKYADILNRIGWVLKQADYCDQAIDFFENSLQIRRLHCKQLCVEQIRTLLNLASAYYRNTQVGQAIKIYQNLLKELKSNQKQAQVEVLAKLIPICQKQTKSNLLQRALSLIQSLPNKMNPKLVYAYWAIAQGYKTKQQFTKAEALYDKTLKIIENVRGKKSMAYAQGLRSKFQLSLIRGDQNCSQNYENIRQNLLNSNNRSLQLAYNFFIAKADICLFEGIYLQSIRIHKVIFNRCGQRYNEQMTLQTLKRMAGLYLSKFLPNQFLAFIKKNQEIIYEVKSAQVLSLLHQAKDVLRRQKLKEMQINFTSFA